MQAFVVHFSGYDASIYWATLPPEYLDMVNRLGIDLLKGTKPVVIHHTKPCHLMDPTDRTRFIAEFVALLRFVGDGKANVGHLRHRGEQIHREDDKTKLKQPPQTAMEWEEMEVFQKKGRRGYSRG